MKKLIKIALVAVLTLPILIVVELVAGAVQEPGFYQSSKGVCYGEHHNESPGIEAVKALWCWALNKTYNQNKN